MRYLLATAVILASTAVHAADKGKPATLAEIMAIPDRSAVTCYVETSVAGTFLKDTREAQAGVGGGCDTKIANVILGAGIRADWADFRDSGSLFAKLGLALNGGAIVYGLAEWKVPGWQPDKAGQLHVGAGTELKLELLNPNLWLFGEATYAANSWGQTTADDVTGRLGFRWKF